MNIQKSQTNAQILRKNQLQKLIAKISKRDFLKKAVLVLLLQFLVQFSTFAQGTGTALDPYTSLSTLACAPSVTPGIYYFNLSGVSFSTYVDANKNILVANDSSLVAGSNLPSFSNLSNTKRGILPPAALATFTTITHARITTSDGSINTYSANSATLSRLRHDSTLISGLPGDNASSWISTGTVNAAITTGSVTASGFKLEQNIIHCSGNAATFNWIPSYGAHRIVWSLGEPNPSIAFCLWVNPSPLPPTNPTATSSSICLGSSSTLSATCTGTTLEWYTNSAATGSPLSSSTVSPTTTTTYYPFCNTGTCKSYAGTPVTITVLPTPVLTANPTNATVCSGTAFTTPITSTVAGTTYKATATLISGAATGFSNITTATATTTNISQTITNSGTVSPVADAVIRYIVTPTANGCTGIGDTFLITVKKKPTVTLVAPAAICSGKPFSVTPTSDVNNTTYTWTVSNVTVPTGGTIAGWTNETTGALAPISQTLTNSGTTLGTVKYTLVASSMNGCVGTITPSTFNVSVNPLPNASVSSTTNVLCNGGNTGIAIASGTAVGAGTTISGYSWSSGAATATASNLTAGTYTATITDSKGCTKTTSATITESAAIVPNATTPVTLVCNNTSTSIDINPYNGVAPYNYSLNGGSYQTTNSFSNQAVGSYTISVKDANNCIKTQLVAINTGLASEIALATTNNSQSVVGALSNSINQADGTNLNYTDNNCKILATINDASGGNVLGSTTVNCTVNASVDNTTNPLYIYGRRKYEIIPTVNGPATYSLYYTQADFDNYNANNGTNLDLPTGPSDAVGIANFRFAKYMWGSTWYLNAQNTSLTWDATKNYWKATFPTNYVGGVFYFYTEKACTVTPTNLTTTNITTSSVTLNWAAISGATWYQIEYKESAASTWIALSCNPNTINIYSLNTNTSYDYRVRMYCAAMQAPSDWATGTFTTLSGTACTSPTLNTPTVGISDATLSWTGGYVWYSIRYKASGTSTWTNTSSSNATINITGLANNTLYDYEVKAWCAPGNIGSNWTAGTFTTNSTCAAPVIGATSNYGNSTTLNWIASGTWYSIRYREVGTTTWTNTSAASNTITLYNLQYTKSYEFEVQSHCGIAASTWATGTFTTNALSRVSNYTTQLITSNEIKLFPNPTTDILNIEFKIEAAALTTVKVMDISGRVIKHIQQESIEGLNKLQLDLSALKTGIYIVEIIDGEKTLSISRIEKN